MSRIPASAPRRWQERIRESRLGTVLVLAVTAAIVSAGAYLVDRPPAAATRATTAVGLTGAGNGAAPNIGSAAQDFTATTLDGKTASLSSDRGKAVWLTFGATWCATCVAEAPDSRGRIQEIRGIQGHRYPRPLLHRRLRRPTFGEDRSPQS